MRPHECRHEDALVEAIAAGDWPEAADASLRAHVAGCSVCGDLAQVATLLHDDRQALCATLAVPPSGAVWWRAQVRARAEAEHAALRPMLVVAAWAAMVLVALIASMVTLGWPWGEALFGEAVAVVGRLRPSLHVSLEASSLVPWVSDRWLAPLLLAGVLVVATPVALYVAARE